MLPQQSVVYPQSVGGLFYVVRTDDGGAAFRGKKGGGEAPGETLVRRNVAQYFADE